MEASEKLADMGYVNVYEFGGIEDWTEDIVTDDEKGGASEVSGERVSVIYAQLKGQYEINMDMRREYRENEVMGEKYRHPENYRLLTEI